MSEETPPVLFLIFNRPDHTREVMERLRQAEPPQLFVGADGPRPEHPDDIKNCEVAREVATRVDWDCELHTLFRDENMGCRKAVSSAITWFFEHVEKGIILEDDCLPHKSFFSYCEYILEKYENDQRVSLVSGRNPLGTWREKSRSYHFSNFGGIWGWATWRPMWSLYAVEDKARDRKVIEEVMREKLYSRIQIKSRTKKIVKEMKGEIGSWDYQWFYARLLNSTLTVVPSKNLISNIGFGSDATHTSGGIEVENKMYNLSTLTNDPTGVFPDREYDIQWFRSKRGIQLNRLKSILKHVKMLLEL